MPFQSHQPQLRKPIDILFRRILPMLIWQIFFPPFPFHEPRPQISGTHRASYLGQSGILHTHTVASKLHEHHSSLRKTSHGASHYK